MRFGNNKIKPNNIIIIPLALDKDSEFLLKKEPIFVAIAASDINTIEKPRLNCIEPNNLTLISFSDSEKIARYPGTNGKTQGDMKDKIPNKKAIKKFTSIYFISLRPYLLHIGHKSLICEIAGQYSLPKKII